MHAIDLTLQYLEDIRERQELLEHQRRQREATYLLSMQQRSEDIHMEIYAQAAAKTQRSLEKAQLRELTNTADVYVTSCCAVL